MKYSPKQYTSALLESLKDKTEIRQKEIINNFFKTLSKNNDWSRLGSILKAVEKKYLEDTGLKKVYVETASPISSNLEKEIEKILGNKVYFLTKTNPMLLAGIKILVDDELLIDASARTKIEKMFINH
ncbi:MAG: hypothetical protein A2174_03470 [Candidatus Portnoybacteria bacterium RBG_13_41_18]|uniref:Uncharacterized protein n=1 Tax=Candidatus Portnoybacteria bacterium RBG_13_41_18 TaxID=1801991 RepID=A0A1G2F771_9BACT|nr:MAG: hypothetical protein A2174_03470 [Candidatus Portnoybacteria bacterium RBG_13_41_18]